MYGALIAATVQRELITSSPTEDMTVHDTPIGDWMMRGGAGEGDTLSELAFG